LKYPKGAGRVSFSNHQSYVSAICARFVQLKSNEIDKRVTKTCLLCIQLELNCIFRRKLNRMFSTTKYVMFAKVRNAMESMLNIFVQTLVVCNIFAKFAGQITIQSQAKTTTNR
jgi:hypothetical protein